jgi:hypothetical protein
MIPISISAIFNQLAVFGCVVKRHPPQQDRRSSLAQDIHEGLAKVRIEVVQHQMNGRCRCVDALH